MVIKDLLDEDFINYRVPSMFIATAKCNFKCDWESGRRCCQNSALASQPSIYVSNDEIIRRYLANPITHAIVFGGLEPMLQYMELLGFLGKLRNEYRCGDTVVIYTGYERAEISSLVDILAPYGNLIIKFGRFRPDQEAHFDEVLGVALASPNQYAERITL